MAREVLVALMRNLDQAEATRRELERAGVPVGDIDMRSRELTGFSSSETAPQGGGLWELLFAREPQLRQHIDANGTLLAVRAEPADHDRIAALLGPGQGVAGVRRYAIADEQRVPLHEEALAIGPKS